MRSATTFARLEVQPMAYALSSTAHRATPAGVVWSTRRAHLVVVAPPAPAVAQRPTPAQFRRRRVVAALLALVVVLATVVTVTRWADRSTGAPLGSLQGAPALSGQWLGSTVDGTLRYVVAAGDSLWTIAGVVAEPGERRALVDDLIRQLGGSRIVPGQVVEIRP